MKFSHSRKKPLFGACLLGIFVFFVYKVYVTYIYDYDASCRKFHTIPRKIVNPPELTIAQKRMMAKFSSKDKNLVLDRLSRIVQSQLTAIQAPEGCDEPNFICGHYDKCGFGCQVHHRVACIMISYSLSLPLIHDETEGWPYSQKWSDLLEPLGSRCLAGNNTFRWTWEDTSALYRGTGSPCFSSSVILEQIEYPLNDGIPIDKDLADILETIVPNPFLWLVGQFVKFALKPRKYYTEEMDERKNHIGFSHPIVGLHVRRTDKIKEAPESHHEIEEYLKAAEKFLTEASENESAYLQKKLFIASDDSNVLPEAQKRFPEWKVTGFLANQTLKTQKDRISGFDDILRDVLILSECDYIVCGLSSNVCRILLEIFGSKYLNGEQRLISLDGKYEYTVQRYSFYNPKILKVEPIYLYDK